MSSKIMPENHCVSLFGNWTLLYLMDRMLLSATGADSLLLGIAFQSRISLSDWWGCL